MSSSKNKIRYAEYITQETSNRVDPLLALRGIAALLVVLCHVNPDYKFKSASYLMWYGLDLTPIRNLVWLLKPNAAVCVWIFFCLSGYLMGKAFFTGRYKLSIDGIKSFYFNRITRIVPLTYAIVFVTALFSSTGFLYSTTKQALPSLLTFTYNLTQEIGRWDNPALWSLSTEMQFYLLVPALYLLYTAVAKKSGAVANVLFLAVCVGVLIVRLLIWSEIRLDQPLPLFPVKVRYISYIYTLVFTNLDVFLAGFLLNPLISWMQALRHSTDWARLWQLGANLVMAGLLLCSSYYLAAVENYHVAAPSTTLSTVLMPSITALVTCLYILAYEHEAYYWRPSPLNLERIRERPVRLLDVLGTLSFGIYVWHYTVFIHIIQGSDRVAFSENLLSTAVALVVTFALATFTYLTIEKPMAKFKRFS